MLEINKIYLEDCLEGMKKIDNHSVDMILCDLPYGCISACKWDVVIPFEPLWEQYKRIIKENGAIVLFGQEPFSSYLRLSNIEWYKYDLIWEKEAATNFMQMKKRFGKSTEMISVFYQKQPTYNPQMYKHEGKKVTNKYSERSKRFKSVTAANSNGKLQLYEYEDNGLRYPKDVLRFNRVNKHNIIHPTQKPTELIEYLIRSFTNEGDLVLDNCMGSGTTAVACLNTKRKFIGFETDEGYYQKANERIKETQEQEILF